MTEQELLERARRAKIALEVVSDEMTNMRQEIYSKLEEDGCDAAEAAAELRGLRSLETILKKAINEPEYQLKLRQSEEMKS